ncbi:MAG: hypothetical protein KKB39_00240 [Nanoarchaeota archaeon]|nr:hypothetical protein [Nanoarchaeota archaeon]
MNKPVRIIMLDEAEDAYKKLNELVGTQLMKEKKTSEEIKLLKSIKQKINFLKLNPFYGDNIPKNLIPKEYDVQNLWRVELVNFWRMLYTIRGDQIEIICFVLDILNHKDYNKKFGYKNK